MAFISIIQIHESFLFILLSFQITLYYWYEWYAIDTIFHNS